MKTNHYFKLATLILLFIFLGCQKEIPKETVLESNKLQMEVKKFGDFNALPSLSEKVIKKIKNSDGTFSKSGRYDELYNFTIDSSKVIAVTYDSSVWYTMTIYRDEQPSNVYENLVIVNKEGFEPKAYLYKYFPDAAYSEARKYDDNVAFSGKVKHIPINYEELFSETAYVVCVTTTTSVCGNNGGPAGPGCSTNEDGGAHVFEITTTSCTAFDDYVSNNENTLDPGNTGGGGGTTPNSDGSSSPTGEEDYTILDTDVITTPLLDISSSMIVIRKLKITDSQQIKYLEDNPLVADNLNNFLLANDTPEGREIVNKAINTLTNLDALKVEFENPNFDPINTPWLDRLRDAAKKIAELISNPKTPAFIKAILILNLDNNLSIALTATALDYNINAFRTDETFKQQTFNESGKAGVGILLYEFANGTGPDTREFNYSGDMVAKMFAGQVSEDIKADFLKIINKRNLSFEKFSNEGISIPSSYGFSPGHTTFLDSFSKHIKANDVQFFIGGSNLEYFPAIETGYINVVLSNSTSRNSLLLHIGDNYARDGSNSGINRPLSTIKQVFWFKLKIY